MSPTLRNRLILAGAGSALAIAGVLRDWYEGTGPTVPAGNGQVLYVPYKDTSGVWTVCHGVTGAEVIPTKRYTEAECAVLDAKHMAIAEAAARKRIKNFDQLNEWQQAALIDWFYNLGENPKTIGSTLVADFNAGRIDAGCRELVKWANGRVDGQLRKLPGLVDRRGTAEDLCLNWKP